MSAPTSDDRETARADVELRLPADSAYASVLRTTTASLAARIDFTMDDIEDLRMAVAEAAALVLPEADPDADITTLFHLGARTMTVEVSTAALDNPAPDLESFAWQVLDTLASEASVESSHGVFCVRFTMTSQLAAEPAGQPTGVEP